MSLVNVYLDAGLADVGNEPAIIYRNYFLEGTVTASGEEPGFPYENALDGLTGDFWIPDALPATLAVDLGVGREINCIGFVGESNGCTFIVEYYNGATWIVRGTFTPTVNVWVGFFTGGVTDAQWRVRITGATVPSVAVLFLGNALRIERRLYVGHAPITMSRVVDKVGNLAEGGQYLGKEIIRRGVQTSIAFKNLTPDFVRDEIDPFIESAITNAFFWCWRPQTYREAAYVWTNDDIAPTNDAANGDMGVSFNVRGIAQ
jgi:hypothetical protein